MAIVRGLSLVRYMEFYDIGFGRVAGVRPAPIRPPHVQVSGSWTYLTIPNASPLKWPNFLLPLPQMALPPVLFRRLEKGQQHPSLQADPAGGLHEG